MNESQVFLSKILSPEDALKRGQCLPFALLRTFSAMSLGPTPETLPDTEEILEARFFSRDEEIRLFRDDGILKAVSLRETPDARVLKNEYEIGNQALGKSLTVREILDFDEDGQAYIALSRLSDWKGAQ